MSRTEVRRAYDRSADAWRRGPASVYARFADAMLGIVPRPLAGAAVLDVGAGTGVAAQAALDRGAASAVATDIAAGMLQGRPPSVVAAVADAARLPFRDRAFDLVTAAFCLGHLPDPGAALAEMRRVGSAVAASAFVPGPGHPVKAAVDEVFAGVGFRIPAWYRHQKEALEPRVDDPDRLAELAREAGFAEVVVHRLDVDTGLETPDAAVAWRLGMAHLAPYVGTLPPDVLAQATRQAEEAVAPFLPVVVPILALSAA